MDELISTRATLLHRLKDWQDHSSWQEFFDIYWRLIHNLALKAGLTRAEAEDVVQETMMAVAKHIPTFKYDPSIGSFKSWLLNMARWRIVDQLRKRRTNSEPSADPIATGTRTTERIVDPASDLETAWEVDWERTLLEAALKKIRRQLDPQKYQIFDFYVNKEWSPEKVAETFGVSVGQVYLAKHRVVEMIRDEVNRLKKDIT
ncbi:MAG: RNA polymerase sigma factor [Verrucomicrobiota bacterium]